MIKRLQQLKARKGFTLVELIVVIAIIGVLAAILIPIMMNYVTNSRISAADGDAKSIFNTASAFVTEEDSKGNDATLADVQDKIEADTAITSDYTIYGDDRGGITGVTYDPNGTGKASFDEGDRDDRGRGNIWGSFGNGGTGAWTGA